MAIQIFAPIRRESLHAWFDVDGKIATEQKNDAY